ncbi:zinc finger, CCHC-type containing protein [Tanacetum coccineum]
MDEAIQVSCITDKLPLFWKDFKHTLKHKKEELTLVKLGSYLRIKESLRVQDSDKPKSNNVDGPSVVNMVKHNNSISSGKIVSMFNGLHVSSIRKNLVSSSVLDNCGYKQVIESNKFVLSKHGVFIGFGYLSNQMFKLNIVNDNIGSTFMSIFKLNASILWHARLGHVHFKMMQDMSKDGLIPAFDMKTKKCKTCMLTKITKKPFQNVKRKTEVLEVIYSDLFDLHATPSLGNTKYFVTFIDDASRFCYVYLLHLKDEVLDKFKVFKTKVELQQRSLIKRFSTDRRRLSQGLWGEAIAVVRLLDPNLKTLGERGIECIFVGYVEHSKAFRFYVIEPNESVSINSIIESRDAFESRDVIFDDNRFSSVPIASQMSLISRTEDIGSLVVPEKDDPNTFDEAMKSHGVALWKEAINDKIDSIMGNNTWVLADLPPVARINIIRLLIALASIHNLIIHQMDVKTTFLNGELDKEVYMNQP